MRTQSTSSSEKAKKKLTLKLNFKYFDKKLTKEKRLFFEETLFFRVVFALVDSQLPLRFDAASFACVLAPQKRRQLKERAFGTEGAQGFSFLSCHHFSEHWQCNGDHDYTEHYEYYEVRRYLRYPCA